VHIVYMKATGIVTYTGLSRDHYEAFMGQEPNRPVKRPKSTGPIKHKLRKRDGDCCWFCGGLMASAEGSIEHLIPISDGGTNALANLVLAHVPCNQKAGNLPLGKKLELRAKLRANVLEGRPT